MFSLRRRLLRSSCFWRRWFFQWNHKSIGRPLYRLLSKMYCSSIFLLPCYVIGDIRSRLIRLIPSAPTSSPQDAIRRLLAYRLPSNISQREARDQWRDIVEGRSSLWKGIPTDRKETIRGIFLSFIHPSSLLIWYLLQGFLVHFESELLKRAHKNFDFRNGRSVARRASSFKYLLQASVGNYFLAAAQRFFRSLPSAIFLFSAITNSQANILPIIATNHTVTIAAELVCTPSHVFHYSRPDNIYRKTVRRLLANARYPIRWFNQKPPFRVMRYNLKYQHLP